MKWVSFFVLSLSLHAAVLVYPVSFGGRDHVEIMQVTILPLEQEVGDTGSQGGNGIPTRRSASKLHRNTSPALEPTVESRSPANPESQDFSANAVATVGDSIGLVLAVPNSANTGSAISNTAANDANRTGGSIEGTGSGNGLGSSGSGLGRGNGNGIGSGPSGTAVALTQARYRDTPKPIYP
jgi:hypothetical protein